jgi:hypothetical protein
MTKQSKKSIKTPTPTPSPRSPVSALVTLSDPTTGSSLSAKTISTPIENEVFGYMEWRTESHAYPLFEITFMGKNPFNKTKNYVALGAIDKPVVLQAVKPGSYKYTISQRQPDGTGTVKGGEIPYNVKNCPSCVPPSPPGAASKI